MARRKRNQEPDKNLEPSEDVTRPDEGESAVLAAVDQYEAEMRGEANPPPTAVEEPAVELETEKTEEPVDDGKPRVALRVFIASGGKRWDQMAGFKSYAIRLKLGPLSISEWREAFNDFMNRPVG